MVKKHISLPVVKLKIRVLQKILISLLPIKIHQNKLSLYPLEPQNHLKISIIRGLPQHFLLQYHLQNLQTFIFLIPNQKYTIKKSNPYKICLPLQTNFKSPSHFFHMTHTQSTIQKTVIPIHNLPIYIMYIFQLIFQSPANLVFFLHFLPQFHTFHQLLI